MIASINPFYESIHSLLPTLDSFIASTVSNSSTEDYLKEHRRYCNSDDEIIKRVNSKWSGWFFRQTSNQSKIIYERDGQATNQEIKAILDDYGNQDEARLRLILIDEHQFTVLFQKYTTINVVRK